MANASGGRTREDHGDSAGGKLIRVKTLSVPANLNTLLETTWTDDDQNGVRRCRNTGRRSTVTKSRHRPNCGRSGRSATWPGAKQACIDAAEALGGEVWPFKMDHEGAIGWEEQEWTADQVEQLKQLARAH